MADDFHVPRLTGVSAGATPQIRQNAPAAASFRDLLAEKLGGTGLKFSKHAQARMESRGIRLSPGQISDLNGAAETAARKGAREALFLLDRLGLVVSLKNRTVITALDPQSMEDNIITNIDSAVILPGQ